MTVKEFKEKLNQFPDEAEVTMFDCEYGCYRNVGNIEFLDLNSFGNVVNEQSLESAKEWKQEVLTDKEEYWNQDKVDLYLDRIDEETKVVRAVVGISE